MPALTVPGSSQLAVIAEKNEASVLPLEFFC